jgi:non-ribosomal peptide synthetase component E (peptide arylation enzyme)
MSIDASPRADRTAPASRPTTLDHFLLGGAPGDVALVDGATALTYADLRAAVERRAAELDHPGVLVLPIERDLPGVLTYLAALALHRPVLLVEPGPAAAERRADLERRFAGAEAHPTHPDLALLLATSGSTGTPKLVRLSRTNLASNARAIADYLGLRSDDTAITTLPLHYCYGLSVLHSHLVAGASVVLSDLSVADDDFWRLAARHRVTGLAGVPYTFDLLAAAGFEQRAQDLPRLRYLTQAGGRMHPDRVREHAALGQRLGHDLYVMYGQTEATARMAYLPPSHAHRHPHAVGVAVPGGALRVHRPDENGVGELVYAGPNVMMGYATTPADLARGTDLDELFTGDLARIGPEGLVEVVGRCDRVAKVFGLRVDLDGLEHHLVDLDPALRLVADADALHAFTRCPRAARAVRERIQRHLGLPATAVRVHHLADLPRTAAGKVDDAALRAHARAAASTASTDSTVRTPRATPETLRDVYAVLLGRPDAGPDDSFVSLGGDSLSYVELSTRLGTLLGRLPTDWPSLSVTELAALAGRPRRGLAPVEIGVVLRAVAILLIVVTHTDLVLVPGGAHLLLAVAGYHLARFALPTRGRRARTRRLLAGVAAVAVPSSLWIGGTALVTGDYDLSTALYLNGLLSGSDAGWSLDWQFWFLEAIVWGFLGVTALLAVPALDRWQRGSPFTAAAVVVGATLALRYATVGVHAAGVERYAVASVLFVLALGWAAAEARTTAQRLAVLAAAYAGLGGYFDDARRELIVVATVALLLWVRPLLLPVAAAWSVRVLAAASLWIYLTHWQVYPPIEAAGQPLLAVLASVAVGVAAHALHGRTVRAVRAVRAVRDARRRRALPAEDVARGGGDRLEAVALEHGALAPHR